MILVTEALRPRQQSSNPLPLWSTTAEERVIVPPHNSIDWRTSNSSVFCISGLQLRRAFGQLTMLAQKAIGHLVRHGHDRESLRVFLLDWAQQIIGGLQTRHHVREIRARWNSRERLLQPRLDSGDGRQVLLVFGGWCETLVRAL